MSDDRWIRRFVPAPQAPTRLVCLPHAGGAASYFLPVAKALAPSVDVLAVQYPGRQDRRDDPFATTVEEMAGHVVQALQPWLDRPLTLFGHSMGASVAYEVAHRLESAGVEPAALFVSGRRAPARGKDDGTYLLTDRELIAEVKALAGAGSALLDDEDIQRMVLPAIRNDYRAAETYRSTAGVKVACPVFSFVGDADPKVPQEEARAWSEYTTGKFEFRVFPGNHFYLDAQGPAVIEAIAEHAAQLRP
jgi:pyochelin biosynthesis protein PchC